MPRPVKRRRVCEPPRNARFGPLDGAPAESVVRVRKDGRWAEFDYLGRRLTEFGTNND